MRDHNLADPAVAAEYVDVARAQSVGGHPAAAEVKPFVTGTTFAVRSWHRQPRGLFLEIACKSHVAVYGDRSISYAHIKAATIYGDAFQLISFVGHCKHIEL